jgi:hypothetical protein
LGKLKGGIRDKTLDAGHQGLSRCIGAYKEGGWEREVYMACRKKRGITGSFSPGSLSICSDSPFFCLPMQVTLVV